MILKKNVYFLVVDFHGEITSEKMAIGYFFDGEATCVVGTHTHVPTADTRILEKGTAYQTDIGMCGDYNSVIGMDPAEPIQRFINGMIKSRFTPSSGEATLSGVVLETNNITGLAINVQAIRIGGKLQQSGLE